MSLDEVGLVAEFRRVHGAHTVILYGSHVRGDATAESDIDIAVFADVPRTIRDARRWNGHLLDGFVYPTAVAKTFPLNVDLLKLVNGHVLLDELERASFRAPKSPSPISSNATASFTGSSSKLSPRALRSQRCKPSCIASRAKSLSRSCSCNGQRPPWPTGLDVQQIALPNQTRPPLETTSEGDIRFGRMLPRAFA